MNLSLSFIFFSSVCCGKKEQVFFFFNSDFSFLWSPKTSSQPLTYFLITPQIPSDVFHISSYSIISDLKAFQLALEKITFLLSIPSASQLFYQWTLYAQFYFFPFKLFLKSCIVLITAVAQTIQTPLLQPDHMEPMVLNHILVLQFSHNSEILWSLRLRGCTIYSFVSSFQNAST